jgi:uncharacterized membrane protein YhaH (DUF805 family)
MNWYLKVLKNYTNFNSRSRRTEFWMFVLFNSIFLIVAAIIDNLLGTTIDTIFGYPVKLNGGILGMQISPSGYFYLLYSLAVFIPGLAVTVRRLHDVGKSGWMLLIGLIPILGAIYLLILLVTDSNLAPNQYGAYPKELVVI